MMNEPRALRPRPRVRRHFRRSKFRGPAALIAIALLSIASTSEAVAAGLVFTDGFEDGTTNKWTQNTGRNKCIAVGRAVDGAAPHTGASMAECNWNGVVAWNDPAAFSTLLLPGWPYKSEFLIRVWVRLANDVDHHNGSKLLRVWGSHGSSDELFIQAYMAETPPYAFLQWLVNGKQEPAVWGDGTTVGDGAWHRFEIYVKENDAGVSNGILRVWKDGRLQQEILNAVSVTPGTHWSNLFLTSNWSNNPGWEHDAENHLYWDDVEIYSDTGGGGIGLMSDGSITSAGLPAPVTTASPQPPAKVSVR